MRCILQHELSMNMCFLHTKGRTFHVEHAANTFRCSRTGTSWLKHHLDIWCKLKHQHEQWSKCISYEGRNGPFCWEENRLKNEKMNSLFEPLTFWLEVSAACMEMWGKFSKRAEHERNIYRKCVYPPICRKQGCTQERKRELKQTVSAQEVIHNFKVPSWPFIR